MFTRRREPGFDVEVYISTAEEGKPVHKRVVVSVPEGASVEDLLNILDKERAIGKNFFRKLLKSGKFFTLLVGDKRIDIPDGLNHRISAGDRVALITPMAGG
ncbi:MAG TPA: hypothetical protein ENF73_04725 [Proteobacteria bacterium]|nr:hypothetical protein [Pseudomonadota bacterium]